jgi:glutamate racemase
MSIQPIGIFDSGIGGTSIFKEVNTLLPNESVIYLADSKYAPYGNKTESEIVDLSIKNVELLLKKNCKLIIVACNTATTNAIKTLRNTYTIPFIGIEPAIKPAALKTKTKIIGVLATKGTLYSDLFHETTDLYSDEIKIVEQVGEGIVPLIESGELHSDQLKSLLKQYLQPMIAANIDYLVLGCTHYPYLLPLIREILPKHIKIIDSGQAVAIQTKTVLETSNLLNTQQGLAEFQFYTNSNPEVLNSLLDYKFDVNFLDF